MWLWSNKAESIVQQHNEYNPGALIISKWCKEFPHMQTWDFPKIIQNVYNIHTQTWDFAMKSFKKLWPRPTRHTLMLNFFFFFFLSLKGKQKNSDLY